MQRRVGMIALLLLGGVSGLVYYAFHAGVESPSFTFTTTSPNNTYTVQLKEQAAISRVPFSGHGNHAVSLSVLKVGGRTVENEGLYGGDVYDDRFLDLFPVHDWISESIIRFGKKDTIPQSQHDEVYVANNTNQVITYLTLRAKKDEMILQFDLQPKSVVKLYVEPQSDQRADLSWIWCKGKFVSGQNILETGTNFKIRGKYNGPAHYCVSVKDQQVSIESREFEGYISDKSDAIVTVPPALTCVE